MIISDLSERSVNRSYCLDFVQSHLSFVQKLVLVKLETLVTDAVFEVYSKISNQSKNIGYFLSEFL